jgi:hypothetical protein
MTCLRIVLKNSFFASITIQETAGGLDEKFLGGLGGPIRFAASDPLNALA